MNPHAARKPQSKRLKKLCALLHRDLGYFFAGIVLIYAISGIAMNHRNSFNPNYSVETIAFQLPAEVAQTYAQLNESDIDAIFKAVDCRRNQYTKHFKTADEQAKILIKGGSSITVDLRSRQGSYEKITERAVLGSMVKLHYNPGRWWTAFADIFASALIIITITGLFIITGKNGIKRRGAILLLLGLLVPLAFLLI